MLNFSNKTLSFIYLILIAINQLDIVFGARCSRVPSERLQYRQTPSNGNFAIRFSDPSDLYRPKEQYTGNF